MTLHPRTRNEFFSGNADWQMIRQVKERVNIPVIGNGDITCAADVVRMIKNTGCDAVMIGRAAMGNPFIFRETSELLHRGIETPLVSKEERIKTALHHLDLACRYKGENIAIKEMRKHFAWYIKKMKGATKKRIEINRASTYEELINAIEW